MARKYRILENPTGSFLIQRKVKVRKAKYFRTVLKKKWRYVNVDGSVAYVPYSPLSRPAVFKTITQAREFIAQLQRGHVIIHQPTIV